MKNKSNQLSFYFLLASAALFFAYVLVSKKDFDHKESSLNKVQPSYDTESSVNHHLQMTHRQYELQKNRVEVKNKLHKKEINRDPSKMMAPGRHWEKNVGLSSESRAVDIARELNKKPEYEMSPDDEIYLEQAKSQFLNQYAEKERQVYIEEFIKKAQDDGYEVILNSDLEVISVRRIK